VVFSGLSTIHMAIQCISRGAEDYLIKGEFDGKLLLKTIQYSIERKKITEKLKVSNERFELVSKATNDVIWDWDISSDDIYMNNSMAVVFGYPPGKSEINWFMENIHPEDREKVQLSLQSLFEKRKNNWVNEYRFRCADGTYKDVFDRGFTLFSDDGKPTRMVRAMTDLTEKKRLEKELAEQNLKQQKMITEITIQAQEKERNELGIELHDNINQILATVKMFLGMVRSGQGYQEELIGKSHEYVNEAMEEIRKLSHSLVAPSLGDIGLKEALEQLTKDTNMLSDLQVNLVMDESFNENILDKNKKLMFYRIVQEQLSNIIKYARAKEAVVAFRVDGLTFFLSVADNGVGFDTSKKVHGIGLKNISNRVEFYAGKMNIISAPGKGCTLEIKIPY
jgi:two-component system sensor histidine kinase UhpB